MYVSVEVEKKELKNLVSQYIREVDEEKHIKNMTVWRDSYGQRTRIQDESYDDTWSVIDSDE